MEDIIGYILNPHDLSPQIATIMDYFRYFFIGLSGIMIISIIYFITNTNLLEEKYYKDLSEFTKTSPYGKAKVSKSWEKLKEKFADDIESERKLAVVEADDLIGSVLEEAGYEGDSLEERLENVSTEIIPGKEDLLEAHQTRRDLVYEPNRDLPVEEAKELMDTYEKTLSDLQLL